MRVLFLAPLLFLTVSGFGQARTITARVLDSETNKPIKSVLVSIYNSEKSTYTNYLGYFQLELSTIDSTLVLSHVGYKRGAILVPKQNKFALSLKPKIIKLDTLYLADFPKQTVIQEDNAKSTTESKYAMYKYGLPNFYTHLGNKIIKSRNYIETSFNADVIFNVDEEGNLSLVNISSNNSANEEFLSVILPSLGPWRSAFQNSTAVSQTFQLIIWDLERIEETQPHYKGGMDSFYKFVQKNLRYPKWARENNIEGNVIVEFWVNEEGNVGDISVLQGIGYGCDKEVIRVIKKSPQWEPGLKNGVPSKLKIVIPVSFNSL